MRAQFSVFFLWILLIACSSSGTPKTIDSEDELTPDSLKKFTYNLLGFTDANKNGANAIEGTGFFLRQNGKLYLITARHVVTNCEGKTDPLPKTILALVQDTSGLPTSSVPVNIGSVTDTMPCITSTDNPDAVAIEVTGNYNVNSVDRFLQLPFDSVGSILICGFPGKEFLKYGTPVYAQASSFSLDVKKSKFFRLNDSLGNPIFNKSYVQNDSLKLDNSYKGYSGSPVFIQDKITRKWRVAGVFCAIVELEAEKDAKTYLEYVDIGYLINKISNN